MHLLVNTGGGDAPGLNAMLRAVTLSAVRRGFRVTGIRRGYSGLLEADDRGLVELDRDAVRGITDRGGTILGTVNRGQPFEFPVTGADGKASLADVSERVIARYRALGADGLIAARTGLETRSLVLGHLQRGGPPTPADRLLALRYGAEAVRLAAAGAWGRMVSFQPPHMTSITLEEALRQTHRVPIDDDAIAAGRDFGVCFGDA
jgi:6-phosphofructokinase